MVGPYIVLHVKITDSVGICVKEMGAQKSTARVTENVSV